MKIMIPIPTKTHFLLFFVLYLSSSFWISLLGLGDVKESLDRQSLRSYIAELQQEYIEAVKERKKVFISTLSTGNQREEVRAEKTLLKEKTQAVEVIKKKLEEAEVQYENLSLIPQKEISPIPQKREKVRTKKKRVRAKRKKNETTFTKRFKRKSSQERTGLGKFAVSIKNSFPYKMLQELKPKDTTNAAEKFAVDPEEKKQQRLEEIRLEVRGIGDSRRERERKKQEKQIAQKKEGERYYTRKMKEVQATVSQPVSVKEKTSFAISSFMIDDFEQTSGAKNSLGSKRGTYSREPSTVSAAYSRNNRESNVTNVLTLSYSKKNSGGPHGKGGWCGFYSVVKNSKNAYLDASLYNFLTFWVKGERGDENFCLGFSDELWEKKGDSIKSEPVLFYLEKETLGTEWQKVRIPLGDFRGIDDTALAAVSICFESFCFPNNQGEGTLYLDNLALEP